MSDEIRNDLQNDSRPVTPQANEPAVQAPEYSQSMGIPSQQDQNPPVAEAVRISEPASTVNPAMQNNYNNMNTQNQTPMYNQPRYNTGYYTSAPGQMPSGSMYSYPTSPYTQPNTNNSPYVAPPQQTQQPKRQKVARHTHVGLIFLCIALSLVCGFFSGFLGIVFGSSITEEMYYEEYEETTDKTDAPVIYEAVDKEIPEAVTQAGVVATVAEIALPSVVEIRTEAVVNNSFYGQYVTEGAGSGVIISEDGYIVTNNHVVAGSSSITVRLTNGDEHKAKLIGTDAQSDIAVIKIEAKGLTPAVFGDSSKLVVGEVAIAIGNPLGELGGTVTDGIISALDREVTVEGETMILLQTNAAVSPGNSGGGLFNSKGELIGIVNAKSSGSSIEGLGFAIPVNTAKPIITDLIENGFVTGRPSIGISIIEITTDYQRYMYNVSEFGVYIQDAISEDLKKGDRIIAIDGNSISTASDIKAIINKLQVGDKVTITVSRRNKIVDVEITLIDSAENNVNKDQSN